MKIFGGLERSSPSSWCAIRGKLTDSRGFFGLNTPKMSDEAKRRRADGERCLLTGSARTQTCTRTPQPIDPVGRQPYSNPCTTTKCLPSCVAHPVLERRPEKSQVKTDPNFLGGRRPRLSSGTRGIPGTDLRLNGRGYDPFRSWCICPFPSPQRGGDGFEAAKPSRGGAVRPPPTYHDLAPLLQNVLDSGAKRTTIQFVVSEEPLTTTLRNTREIA